MERLFGEQTEEEEKEKEKPLPNVYVRRVKKKSMSNCVLCELLKWYEVQTF